MSQQQTAGPIFQKWLRAEIEPFMKGRGWKRHGLVFESEPSPNVGLIEFRRSKWSTAERYEFFIEAGVYSPRLVEEFSAFTQVPVRPRPEMGFAVLTQRLSTLIGESSDVFWRVRSPSLSLELEALGESVRQNLEAHLITWVEAHLTDQQIRDFLLEHAEGIGMLGLRQLRRLLVDLGPSGQLAFVDKQIEREPARREAITVEAPQHDIFGASDEDVRAADEAMRRLLGPRTT